MDPVTHVNNEARVTKFIDSLVKRYKSHWLYALDVLVPSMITQRFTVNSRMGR